MRYMLQWMLATILVLPAGVQAKEWTWTSPDYVPCESIAVRGSFAVHAEPKLHVDRVTGHMLLDALTVWAQSDAFEKGTASISVVARVMEGGTPVRNVPLVPASRPAASRPPGPHETPALSLPESLQLLFAPGQKLVLDVSATVTRPEGSCTLGSTDKEFDPFAG